MPIFLITHPRSEQNKYNPRIIDFEQLEELATKIRQIFQECKKEEIEIYVGIGIRHITTLLKLLHDITSAIIANDYEPAIKIKMSELFGVREALSTDGKIIFEDGKEVPFSELQEEFQKRTRQTKNYIEEISSQSGSKIILIVGSRLAAIAVGIKDPKSGIIYRIKGIK